MKQIMRVVVTAAMLAARLVMLLVSPTYCRGAISETAAQDIDPTPCAKNAIVRMAITPSFDSTKLTSTIDAPSNVPMISGALRAVEIDTPRGMKKSER